MHPEDLIARWRAWDEYPGAEAPARKLAAAVAAYVGLHQSCDMYRHVAAQRQAGLSISAAVYTWKPT